MPTSLAPAYCPYCELERIISRSMPSPDTMQYQTRCAAAASTRGSATIAATTGKGSAGAVPALTYGSTTRSERLPRMVLRLSSRKPLMIERIMISAATATKIPTTPIRLVRRRRR
jgi:hypothetical protein